MSRVPSLKFASQQRLHDSSHALVDSIFKLEAAVEVLSGFTVTPAYYVVAFPDPRGGIGPGQRTRAAQSSSLRAHARGMKVTAGLSAYARDEALSVVVGGAQITVHRGFDAALLREVVSALGASR